MIKVDNKSPKFAFVTALFMFIFDGRKEANATIPSIKALFRNNMDAILYIQNKVNMLTKIDSTLKDITRYWVFSVNAPTKPRINDANTW